MNAYTFTHEGRTFKRINRTKARAAYNNGLPVILCPCNLRPFGPWHPETVLDPRHDAGYTFELSTDFFALMNCVNGETGKRPAYYIPVRTVDKFTGEPCTASHAGAVEEYDYSFMEA